MRKSIIGLTAAAAVLAFSAVAFAAYGPGSGMGMGGHFGMGPGGGKTLTAQEKADFAALESARMKLMKENLAEDVQAGRISQKEADARLTLMQERFERMKKDDFNRKPMTDADRELMKARHLKMVGIHKDFLQKQVAEGKLTQEEVDKRINRMTERANGNPGERGPKHGGMGPRGDMGGPMGPMGGDCPQAQQ